MRLYACIISTNEKAALLSVAQRFSYAIELLDDGILFDVSGLQNLIGDANKIKHNILTELKKNSVTGFVAVAETTDTAMLLAYEIARQRSSDDGAASSNPKSKIQNPKWEELPLQHLLIEDDTLNVFNDLGIKSIRDLQQIPPEELIRRYGRQFRTVIDVIEQKSGRLLTPNVKENKVSWNYQLDFPVDDFEQLVFILNHGLDKLLSETDRYGFSTEQLDLSFKLQNKIQRLYEIKTSFPTLEKSFWLKLINLRISLDPPESEIVAIDVTSHFTPPRPAQRGLYAVSRPEPERLLLTVNKLKKLVGEENVGVPVLLDQRIEKAFDLDSEKMPEGKEALGQERASASKPPGGENSGFRDSAPMHRGEACLAESALFSLAAPPPVRGVASEEVLGPSSARQASPQCNAASREEEFPFTIASRDEALPFTIASREEIPNSNSQIPNPIIAFIYFNPPVPAEVLVRDKKLVFLRTQYFSGHVTKYSGIWKANSKWWDRSWKAQEWDVEVEDHGVYRLCKVDKDWFLAGEYD